MKVCHMKNIKRIRLKIKSCSAQTVVGNLFVFLISVTVLLLILSSVRLFAAVKNSRDSLERAVLNTAAVNEYKLYGNFRENIIDDVHDELISSEEVIYVLTEEFGLEKKIDGIYKMKTGGSYYYKLTDIAADTVVEHGTISDRYRIEASAVLHVPINVRGIRDMSFRINVSCVYISKMNAEK